MTTSGVIGRLCLVCALGCTPQVEPVATRQARHRDPTAASVPGSASERADTSRAPAEPSFEPSCAVAPPIEPPSAEGTELGPAVRDGDRVVQRAAGGQWVAVCRPAGERGPQPRLVLDGGTEHPLDRLEATDPTGRFVLITRAGHRWLLDTGERREHDLGPLASTIPGSLLGTTLAYGRRTGEREELVLLDALTHAERVLPSPRPRLHHVELDRSGDGLWLTTLEEPEPEPESDPLDEQLRQDADRSPPHMCTTDPGCLSTSTAPRRLGLLWLGPAPESTPTFVDLDETPAHPRALAGAVVLETDRGIELVHADRRETIAEPGCRLDPEHYDPTALRLLCEQDDARVRIERYQDGRREPWTACGP